MPALYKGFNCFRPVFFGLVLAACLAFAAPASAQYTVEGVEVDVTAANAVQLRTGGWVKDGMRTMAP